MENADKPHQGLRESGIRVEKVELDVEELLAWCETRGLDLNASATKALQTVRMPERVVATLHRLIPTRGLFGDGAAD